MTALDVVTIQEAKDLLRVTWDDDNNLINAIIKTAVSYIEQKTQYYLYKRDVFEFLDNGEKIFRFPVALKDAPDGVELHQVGKLYSKISFPNNSSRSIELTIGYDDRSEIPAPLIEACKRLIVFMYDTKEASLAQVPTDVYMLIHDWIRDRTI